MEEENSDDTTPRNGNAQLGENSVEPEKDNVTCEEIKRLREEQHVISTQLSEMTQLMQSEFSKMDQKLDTVCHSVSQTTSILNELLEGSCDCPRLFVVVPIPRATALVGHKDALHGWYQAVSNFFLDPNLLLCDSHSVRLYPLCAYSMEPVGGGMEILHPKKHLQEISFALQIGAAVLSTVALTAYPMTALLPGMDAGAQASLRYVTALRASLAITDSAGEVSSKDESAIALDAAQSQIFKQLEDLAVSTDGQQSITSALHHLDKALLQQVKPLANASYTKIRQLLTHADPDLHTLRGLMCPAMNAGTGDVQWVKVEHAAAWRNAHISSSYCELERVGSDGGNGSGVITKNTSVHTHTSSITTATSVVEHEDHVSALTMTTCAATHGDVAEVIRTVQYDPWVVVAHPTVSAVDCSDVNALTEWLHNGDAHLRASVAEQLAVALVLDNCGHVSRLAHRLTADSLYLNRIGGSFLTSEDLEDVTRAVYMKYMPSMQQYPGEQSVATAGGGGRSWCVIS